MWRLTMSTAAAEQHFLQASAEAAHAWFSRSMRLEVLLQCCHYNPVW